MIPKIKIKILMLSDPKAKSCCLLLKVAGKAVSKYLSKTVEKGDLKHNLIFPYNISLQELFFKSLPPKHIPFSLNTFLLIQPYFFFFCWNEAETLLLKKSNNYVNYLCGFLGGFLVFFLWVFFWGGEDGWFECWNDLFAFVLEIVIWPDIGTC